MRQALAAAKRDAAADMYETKEWVLFPSGGDNRNIVEPYDERISVPGWLNKSVSRRKGKKKHPIRMRCPFTDIYDHPEIFHVKPRRVTYKDLKRTIEEQKSTTPLATLKVYNMYAKKNTLFPRMDRFYESR